MLLLLLLLVPGWENTMAVKDGEAPKLHPKMPNVISETYRKKRFWLLFPLAAAMNFGFCCCWSPFETHRKR